MKKLILTPVLIALALTCYSQVPTEGLVGYWPFSGNANDFSGNDYHGITYGPLLWEDRFGNEKSSYRFDGIDDSILIKGINEVVLSFSCWIATGSSNKKNILTTLNGGVATPNYGVLFSVPEDKPAFFVGTSFGAWGDPGNFMMEGDAIVNDGQWHHIVVTIDPSNSNNCSMYVDGLFATAQTTGDITAVDFSVLENRDYSIGVERDSDYPFNGYIDQIRFYNRWLNQNEVELLFNEQECPGIVNGDTATYFVSSGEFEAVSKKLYLDSTDFYLTTGGCDSLVNHYSEFVFEPNYHTDTLYVTIQDTLTTEVFDTTYVTINDTIPVYDSIAVTDTLYIDAVLTDINTPDFINTIRIYPNPTKDYIFINTGDYSNMYGYRIIIIDQIGASVFDNFILEPLYEINLSTWSGKGLYLVQLLDQTGEIIEVRKIILQ